MPVVNAKGRPFSWAFSALDNFEGCPLRYAHEKFYCTIAFVESDAIRWGNRVHKAAELFLRGIDPNDDVALAESKQYCDAMIRSGHGLESELEVALTRDMKIVSWFDKATWFRVKIDVTLTKPGGHVVVYDWKTGGRIKENDDQLLIALAILALLRQNLVSFSGYYIWTKHKRVVPVSGGMILAREQVQAAWQAILPRVQRIEDAWETENFPARKSGLCGWCQVSKKYCMYKK
jgi:hypothetical protein